MHLTEAEKNQPQQPSAKNGWRQVGQKIGALAQCALGMLYRLSYITGIQTARISRAAGRRLYRLLTPVGRMLYRVTDKLLLRHLRRFAAEMRRVGQGFVLAGRRMCAAWQRHPLLVVPQALMLPVLAFRRHRKLAVSVLNLAAPVAAAFVLFFTVQYWGGLTFGLELEYDGQKIGFIQDESVYAAAANMATERVNNTDNSFQVQQVPKLTIAVVNEDEMLDETALCDQILRSSSDSIAQVSGLYIDGQFEGAVESRAQLDAVLNGIRNAYRTGEGNERAEFIQDVEVVDGLYPISSVVSADKMEEKLTAQTVVAKHYAVQQGDVLGAIARKHNMTLDELRALNPEIQGTDKILIGQELLVQRPQPYLRVQVVRTISYTEAIPYETEQIKDNSQYVTYEKVKTKGVEGSRDIVAEVTMVDGVEQSRKIISSTVTKEPTTKVVVVGTKKKTNSAGTTVVVGDGVSTGKFVWPVPICHNMSRGFSRGHKALDITNGPIKVLGQKFIAADGGVVVEASNGWNGGYGNMIRIRHSGGYETIYAHCKTLYVVPGQKVTKGQVLGLIGSTGRSTGPHLHFEIRKNGRAIDPMQFFR